MLLLRPGILELKDEAGSQCGTVKVAVRWRRPLRHGGRDLGPNALTAIEVEDVMARFSPHKDGQVNAVQCAWSVDCMCVSWVKWAVEASA